MSILDYVRAKYKVGAFDSNVSPNDTHQRTSQIAPTSKPTPKHETDKTDISPFGSNGSPFFCNLDTSDPAVVEALALVEMRVQGIAPDHYTASTDCLRCGPVPIWQGCPPRVLGCPWCFNRLKGLPMPKRGQN